MIVGLSYDLKESICLDAGWPDDALEEYDSRDTVQAIANVLEAVGHSVLYLGGGREFLTNIQHTHVDFVFNIAEGLGNLRSREAQIPSVLEMLDIPYSGSDPQCLAVCLDKPLTKKLVATAGIATPRWKVFDGIEQLKEETWDGFPFPVFVKPCYEGSSKGIRYNCKAENAERAIQLVAELLAVYRQPVMVEEYINGDEVTVGMVGNSPPEIIGVMRVLPRDRGTDFVYSIEVKRCWENLVEYECPARLDDGVMQKIVKSSTSAFEVLGCRDIARIDYRIASSGIPYFLEINPLPGLNPYSGDVVIMAKKMGCTYDKLILTITDAALRRKTKCVLKK